MNSPVYRDGTHPLATQTDSTSRAATVARLLHLEWLEKIGIIFRSTGAAHLIPICQIMSTLLKNIDWVFLGNKGLKQGSCKQWKKDISAHKSLGSAQP